MDNLQDRHEKFWDFMMETIGLIPRMACYCFDIVLIISSWFT